MTETDTFPPGNTKSAKVKTIDTIKGRSFKCTVKNEPSGGGRLAQGMTHEGSTFLERRPLKEASCPNNCGTGDEFKDGTGVGKQTE